MARKKHYPFVLWIVLLCLFTLLGIVLFSYGCATWDGAVPLLSQEVLPHV